MPCGYFLSALSECCGLYDELFPPSLALHSGLGSCTYDADMVGVGVLHRHGLVFGGNFGSASLFLPAYIASAVLS